MKNAIKWFGILVFVAVIGFTMVACDNGGGSGGGNNIGGNNTGGNNNQTPVASNYTFGNLDQIAGSVTAVTIAPKSGSSSGARTVKYNNSTTIPQTAGTYAITFDVAAATGWNAAAGLSAGNLVVYPNIPINNWTAITLEKGNHLYDIAYGDNKWVAAGYDSLAYSSDGVTWTANTILIGIGMYPSFTSVAYGGGKWVVGGIGGGSLSQTGRIYYSDNGESWSIGSISFGYNNGIASVAYGGAAGIEKFVAVGGDGKMAYSANGGGTWTMVADNKFEQKQNGMSWGINGVTYGGDKFVAVGSYGQIAYSADGIVWTAVADSKFRTNESINGVTYGGGKFVAVGSYGQIAYSADGIVWTAVADSKFGTDNYIRSVAYGGGVGSEKFVAVGEGKMAYSADGVTWTAVADSKFRTNERIYGIAYGGGKWVAVGENGKMAYSVEE